MQKIRTKKLKGINEKTLLAIVDLSKATNMGHYEIEAASSEGS